MADPRQFRLRVRYGKTGRLAMLSHLELTHALERTVRRSGLPFALSQGFSPHMRIAFGPALPVGVGGTQEVFDVTLLSYVPPERALQALQAAAPVDLAPISCEYVEASAQAASVAFRLSTYCVLFDAPFDGMRIPDAITVTRKGKEKVLSVPDFLVDEPKVEGRTLTFTLRSQPTGSLRADAFVDGCLGQRSKEDGALGIVSFTRIQLA